MRNEQFNFFEVLLNANGRLQTKSYDYEIVFSISFLDIIQLEERIEVWAVPFPENA